MTSRLLPTHRSTWAYAALLAFVGMGLRTALQAWLHDSMPFVFAFPVIATAALLLGALPALLTLLLCALWSQLPHGLPGNVTLLQLAVFSTSSGLLIGLCAWLRPPKVPVAPPAPASTLSGWQTLQDTSAPATEPPAERWLRFLLLAALAIPLIFFGVAARQSHEDAFAKAQERTTRSAAIAREHALKIMRTNEVMLKRVADAVEGLDDAAIALKRPQLEAALRRMAGTIPEIDMLAVLDAEGRPLLLSKAGARITPDAREHNFFVTQVQGDGGVYLSAPLPDQIEAGQGHLVASARRNLPNGRFGGVYAVALNPMLLNQFYQDLILTEPGASISLFRGNGMIITREPPPPAVGMVAAPSGVMMSRVSAGETDGVLTIESPIDGLRRLIAFRQVEGYGLYVSASISHEAIRSGWYPQVLVLAAFTLPAALALAWITWLVIKHTRRERQALSRWQAESVKRSQVEDALRQTQRLEALGHLTGGVAHDVNNLLMVISNNAYLLKNRPEVEPVRRLEAIQRAVNTGARLTRQLLTFARRQAVRPEVIDLRERLEALADLMRHSMSSKVELIHEAAPDTGFVRVDPAELELALINLAVNARDAMPEGGRLRVSVGNATEPGPQGTRRVQIVVSDNGCGIPPEHQARVFEPFFSTKEVGRGTGLGLSQVYGFCQQAGGEARLHSTVGLGTDITLLLPAVQDEADIAPAVQQPPSARGRLLLVEDNDEVAAATQPLLEAFGYAVLRLASADAALAHLRTGAIYDLMLTDIVMPGELDGLALARAVQSAYPRIGVVLMTGYARETANAVAEGFVLLQKPWTAEALATALQRVRRTP